MELGKQDPVTGRMTTGHEWNGIEELDTPVPRIVLFFLAAGTLFAVIYWILMPAWPLWSTYTKGLLGNDQREVVARQVEEAAAERAAWTDRVTAEGYAQIEADPALMQKVRETGRTLFDDNCAVCHGVAATGGPGFPSLAAKAWLWGGGPEAIAETIRVGINSTDPDTRVSQMMAFGKDGVLDRRQIGDVVAYVQSLSQGGGDTDQIKAGQEVFIANCVACHGDDGKGKQDVGAPDLTDDHWIYGGDTQSIYTSVYSGRQGHMPHWGSRLSPLDIKILALYVSTLGSAAK
ncbi:Cbb3-type cytochrome c oxidase subunit [Mesorhizobium sp. L-8-10]|uniref:cytochrome-c oxidase, cbb3-type subunit III n=1 Tax=unclassified Mesorhizobium TaxID=325217 RepID=UPI0019289A5E|nr:MULTISPECIES: cytochrome-c oxidase, cbb3-type subunit III [unclassified Mesorhizobium]BCH25004.1 Cbb3-type cytochrome c oxidase subunit [Mesorhizobium sp. L-8-3]BCH32781.1 Cbb3-type cytochrome c oxidase subunit [Mesorhizobium sp. L-8-10]